MVNLGPSRLLSSPGAAALFVASSPSTSSGNVIANPALAPHQKVMRDEFLALKKKMSEVMGKHKSARKEVRNILTFLGCAKIAQLPLNGFCCATLSMFYKQRSV